MIKTEAKRAVAYLRVSNLSQLDGHSLDAQARLFNEILWKQLPAILRPHYLSSLDREFPPSGGTLPET